MRLGGVAFPDEPRGPDGHSDGDAALHALIDALLGAARARAMSARSSRPTTRRGRAPIRRTCSVSGGRTPAREHGWRPAAADLVIVVARPSIASRRDEIVARIAELLGVDGRTRSRSRGRPPTVSGSPASEGIAAWAVGQPSSPPMSDWIGGRRPVARGARRRTRGASAPHLGQRQAVTGAARDHRRGTSHQPADRPRARRPADAHRRLRRPPGRPARGRGAPLGRRSTRCSPRARTAGHDPFVLVLEHLQDPTNFGTLLRSAEAAGVDGVVFPERGAAPLSAAAVKASAGASEHLLLGAPADDRRGDPRAQGRRPAAGGRRPGGDRIGLGERPDRARWRSSSAARGAGLSGQTKRRCDLLVSFPMAGRVASLNASTAGALLLFEVVRQRL